MSGFVNVEPDETMIAAAKAQFEAARRDPGATAWVAVENPWYGYLAELCVQKTYSEAGIPVKWDGGVNGAPDFSFADGTSADVKTFTIARGPFRPTFSVGALPGPLLGKALKPDGLVFCVWDEGKGLMTLIGAIAYPAFVRRARLVRAGERLASGAEARADELLLEAKFLTPMERHLLHRKPKGRSK